MELTELEAALAVVDDLPYGPARISRREELVSHAEQCGARGVHVSALLSLADDCHAAGDEPGMIVAFGRAWRVWQTRPEDFDGSVRFRFREHFPHVIDALAADPRVPAAEVDRLMDEMEAFYLAGGYSLRAVHRSRYWVHRRRDEDELATLRIEALLAEDGDAGASCDACDLATAAYWYERLGEQSRAISLWRAIIAGVRSCDRPHVALAHGELMIDLLKLGRAAEAREHHLLGYPTVRRHRELPRQLELHALYVNRTQDVLRGLELLHDHIDWLPEHRDAVGALWWVHGQFLTFLRLLIDVGHADLPVTRSPRQLVTAAALYAQLDAVLADYATHQDAAGGTTEHARMLEDWRTAKLSAGEPVRDVAAAGFADQGEAGKAAVPEPEPEPEPERPPVPMPWDVSQQAAAMANLPRGFEPADALAARARYLSHLRHPYADAVWEQVAACSAGLSDGVAAELSESRATTLALRGEHAAAHERLAFAATLHATLGRTTDALRCRAMSAYELYLTGDDDADTAAQRVQDEAWKAAQAEFGAGRMTGTQLVTVRLYAVYRQLDRWRTAVEAHAGVDDDVGRLITTQAQQEFQEFCELADARGAAPQHAAAVHGWVRVTASIARRFAREEQTAKAAEYYSSLVRRLEELAGRYAALRQPWFAAEAWLRCGRALLSAGDAAGAERCARRVLALGAPPVTEDLPAATALLLAEALEAQGGREEEAASAVARAAALLAGSDQAAAARARVLMGEIHHRAGRHQQAVDFYQPALALIADRWDEDEHRTLIHRAASHFSVSLCELDRAADAVRVLRDVLARMPEQAAARAWLLHQLAESARLAGRLDDAVAAYRAAALAGRRQAMLQPVATALESAARLVAPSDIRAALALLDEAVAHLTGCRCDDAPSERHRAFLLAEARTLAFGLLIDRIVNRSLPLQDGERLLSAARQGAETGTRELWSLLERPEPGDERERYATALESALRWLSHAAATLDGDRDTAARWQSGFAQDCTRWGLAEHARTARRNAEFFAGRALSGQ